MKKSDKEYIEDTLNELVYSDKKPSKEQLIRLGKALEKIKNSKDDRPFMENLLRGIYNLFTKDG